MSVKQGSSCCNTAMVTTLWFNYSINIYNEQDSPKGSSHVENILVNIHQTPVQKNTIQGDVYEWPSSLLFKGSAKPLSIRFSFGMLKWYVNGMEYYKTR